MNDLVINKGFNNVEEMEEIYKKISELPGETEWKETQSLEVETNVKFLFMIIFIYSVLKTYKNMGGLLPKTIEHLNTLDNSKLRDELNKWTE